MLADNVGCGDRDGLRDARAVADTFAVRELRVLCDCIVDTVKIVENVLIDVAERESRALFDELESTVYDGVSDVPADAVRVDKPELFVGPSEAEEEIVTVFLTVEVANEDVVLVAAKVVDRQEVIDGIKLFDSSALREDEKFEVTEGMPFVAVTLLLDVAATTLWDAIGDIVDEPVANRGVSEDKTVPEGKNDGVWKGVKDSLSLPDLYPVLDIVVVAEFDPNNEFDATLVNENIVETDADEVTLAVWVKELPADIVNTSE